jgi:hypothetical protein
MIRLAAAVAALGSVSALGIVAANAGTAAPGLLLPMLSMIGHPSGDKPLMMDVRQSAPGSERVSRRVDCLACDVQGHLRYRYGGANAARLARGGFRARR